MKIKIAWRGWRFSPLLIIGRYTLWFTNGISFGKSYNYASIIYYVGWLIVRKDTKTHHDFVERINAGTWPTGWLWIVKYSQPPKKQR